MEEVRKKVTTAMTAVEETRWDNETDSQETDGNETHTTGP